MTILLDELVRSVELWMSLLPTKKKQQQYVDPNLDPVLLVPGIGGSILEAVDDNGKRERVWVRIFGADHELKEKLWSRFDPKTGETVSLDSKTKIVVPEDRHGLYAIDALDPDMIVGRESAYYFHDMIAQMIRWGFEEGKTLFGFGYDFRQSNRLKETLDRFAARLKSVYKASGGKKINLISHSMGGLLVKCFMCLHTDVFEKYVQNWIAIAAPFNGAPGYVTSALLNGMSFVEGWQQNFFVSMWSMHQLLIECPSVYELLAFHDFRWQHNPILEIWRQNHEDEGNSNVILESYSPAESISILEKALSSNMVSYDGVSLPLPFNEEILRWANETHRILSRAKLPSKVKFYNIYGTGLETAHSVCYGDEDVPVAFLQQLPFLKAKYVCVDGDGTVPMESAKADGLHAEARVGVPGEHRGLLCDHHVFRILKHWLKAGDPDPYYDPLNDYVILPTAFEMEKHKENGVQVTSVKEEWDVLSGDQIEQDDLTNGKPSVSSISISGAANGEHAQEETHATLIIHPQSQGKQHVELNAVGISSAA